MKFRDWLYEVKHHRKKILVAFLFLMVAVALYSLSGDYVADYKNPVASHDIILDNIGPYNLSFIFIWLFIPIIAVLFLYPIIFKPGELHYVLNMFSLFTIIRSGFVIFTHLKPPVDAIIVNFPSFFNLINFSNDLFFSGHTGIPFLAFLIFRKHHKGLSYFMLACSIILGTTALLMHVHYSIDVFSAFFITYGIYRIGNMFIRR